MRVRRPAPNTTLNLAPFGRWTLRDEAAQRRLAPREEKWIVASTLAEKSTKKTKNVSERKTMSIPDPPIR